MKYGKFLTKPHAAILFGILIFAQFTAMPATAFTHQKGLPDGSNAVSISDTPFHLFDKAITNTATQFVLSDIGADESDLSLASSPIAQNDIYYTNKNTTLTIPAPGVLANDTDADGDLLDAVSVTNPAHGNLTLNHNGRFVYAPNNNYAGSDSFTYRANDGNSDSNIATVTIYVNTIRTVTKTADTNDAVCAADCSLREAIAVAVSGDTVEFASPLFDSPQTITLSDAVNFRQLFIDKNLTINGTGANLLTVRRAPDAAFNFRVFSVNGAAGNVAVNLNGMTITGGNTLGSSVFNSAGGGVFSSVGFPTLTINRCNITGNATNSVGGGVYNGNGNLIITNSAVSNNIATGTVVNSNGGGGIHTDGGNLTITNSTVSGNVKNNGNQNGGGIAAVGISPLITHTTITDNQADGANSASGLYSPSGTFTVRNSIIAANRSNTTVPDVAGAFTSQGYNIIGNVGTGTDFNQIGDQTGTSSAPVDPMLAPLALSGGTTPTHALRSGSRAIDKGNSFGITTDQRGQARPFDNPNILPASGGDNTDIGAFETPAFAPLVVTKTADTNDGACDSDCSLREAIAAAGASGDEIQFASPLFDSPQTVTLSDASGFRELVINKNLTISGRGANLLTVRRASDAAANFRIFHITFNTSVAGNPTVNLKGMTITGGSDVFGNVSLLIRGGGGIRVDLNSSLLLANCHITGNFTDGNGGGIYKAGTDPDTLTVLNSTISDNVADGIYNNNGGGGIHYRGAGLLTVTNSTVSGNVRYNNNQNGGGVYAEGPAVITSSTITDNRTDGADSAGGFYSSNFALTVRNTIIAANRNNTVAPDVAGIFASQGYNFIGNAGSVTAFNQTGDRTGTDSSPLDARIFALALNGGTTPAHALRIDSPVLDKGKSFGTTTDQRGQARPVNDQGIPAAPGGDNSDIGAYEIQSSQLPPVRGENPSPVAGNDYYTVNEDGTLTVNALGLLTNDIDPNNDALTAILATDPNYGVLDINANGGFTYTPAANYNGADSFTYKASDGYSNSNIVTVSITINSVNDAPVAMADSYNVSKNTTLNVTAPGILANDTDSDNDPLTVTLINDTQKGELTLNSNGSFSYSPLNDYTGADSFTYKANDGNTDSNVVTVSINVTTIRTVTKTADTSDGTCNADCSLREAIAAALTGDTIEFAAPLFDSPQTILLSNTDGFRDLIINKSLTIKGKGANLLTVEGPGSGPVKFRVFTIGENVTVNLSGMKITNGYARNTDGGGVSTYGSLTTITNCYFTGNVANGGVGGAVRNAGGGTLTVVGSTITNNASTDFRNSGGGSGIHNEGTLSLINSTISENYKYGSGGSGGGIWTTGTATITSSTITDNQAEGQYSAGGVFSSIGSVTIRNTIIAANRTALDVYGSGFVSQGYNLIGNADDITAFTNAGDQAGSPATPINPRLDPLANYGGTMPTHRLQTSPVVSPAIDKGNSFGLITDQRGSSRPSDAGTIVNLADGADIGAYELQLAPTAASVTVSGRVTDSAGKGIRNVLVTMTDSSGATWTTLSTTFGKFSFTNVPAGETYIFSASARRFMFTQPAQIFSITEDTNDIFFVGESLSLQGL